VETGGEERRTAGIDEMTIGVFRQREEDLLREIQEKVQAGFYRFKLGRFRDRATNRALELPLTC
jgi:hypothetical protein